MATESFDLRELSKRIPLWQEHWMPRLEYLCFHPAAPSWSVECGDRQTLEDRVYVQNYQEALKAPRPPLSTEPDPNLVEWILNNSKTSLFFQRQLHGLDLVNHANRDWSKIPPMSRQDLQKDLYLIIPQNADLNRLIVNPTSGTTGQPIPCPSHPRAQGCYDPLDLFALKAHGMKLPEETMAPLGIQLCYQKSTITYSTLHSFTGGRGFAKVNIHPDVWKTDQAKEYLQTMNPAFLSGDPLAFLKAIELGIRLRPQVLLSTALTLTTQARKQIEAWFEAPVCDIYSLNETGPLAYSDPQNSEEMVILPHDVFIEVINEKGEPLPDGEVGQIAVTGGRNPYLPLLRYLTGDEGALIRGSSPRLVNFQGRSCVIFTTGSHQELNSIDVARILKKYPLYAYQFIQHPDLSCTLKVNAPALTGDQETQLLTELTHILEGLVIQVEKGLESLPGKTLPFIRE